MEHEIDREIRDREKTMEHEIDRKIRDWEQVDREIQLQGSVTDSH